MRFRHVAIAVSACAGLVAGFTAVGSAQADAPSGAIFTTVRDGTEVNFNIYASKDDVYLDGGPGPGAPQTAAGLDDGTYVFQVTDPSGKELLSLDAAQCRRFVVSGGIITGVVATGGCEHDTGVDVDHGATTVQLMPYKDTSNPGGEYKVWATRVEDFPSTCLPTVDCRLRGTKHGFTESDSKTDNFKVGPQDPVEIDTRFHDQAGALIDGLGITWTDTLGATNHKWSYFAPQLSVFHEAHVEAVETGTHRITIADQPGCTVQDVRVAGADTGKNGPQTVSVAIRSTNKPLTVFVDVDCA